MAQVINILPANPGDMGSILGLGRSPGEGNSNPLQYSCWEIPWTEEPGRLQSMGSQRVRHDLSTKQVHYIYSVTTLQMSPSSDFFILVIVLFSFLFSIWFFSFYFFPAVFCLFICFKGNHNCFLKHFYDRSLQSMSDNSNI